MAAPVFATDDVPSADDVNGWFVNILYKRTLATQSRTSTTTLSDDSYMFLTVEANAEYHVECLINYGGPAAADLKLIFATPAGATFVAMGQTLVGAATGQSDNQNLPYGGNASEVWGTTGAGQQFGTVTGILVVGGTAGTFKIQWAQNTSNATPTQVFGNSYLLLRRVA